MEIKAEPGQNGLKRSPGWLCGTAFSAPRQTSFGCGGRKKKELTAEEFHGERSLEVDRFDPAELVRKSSGDARR